MRILSSWDLINGKTADKDKYNHLGNIKQPLQAIPSSKKTEEWAQENVDWFEWLGIQQLKSKSARILKNYKLAKGIIDKSDYMYDEQEVDKETNFLANIASKKELDEIQLLDLNFFPIIPNVVNLLGGEFSKRNIKSRVKATDSFSKNEKLEDKMQNLQSFVESQAKSKLLQEVLNSGYMPSTEEEVQQMKEQLDKQVQEDSNVKELSKKDYRTLNEQWAQHRLNVDEERFKIYEQENIAFRDLIITDSEYWHVRLGNDDYKLESWSPLYTFHYKSPDVKYVSDGLYAGRILMMTVADIIDTFKDSLESEDIEKLEQHCIHYGVPLPTGAFGEHYYDETSSKHDQAPNSVHYQKLLNGRNFLGTNKDTDNIFHDWLQDDLEQTPYNVTLFTVTELYWKSQRKVGILYSIDDTQELTKTIVTDEFEITIKPLYDTSLVTEENERTLIYGEHVNWFYINQVFQGKKINSILNNVGFNDKRNNDSIYIDCGPLPFQFKSEESLWDAKLPVEGISCTDHRLNIPVSPVDLMKPYQIIFNLVNNQLKDILIDEIGTVVMIDPRFLPKKSPGDDWGDDNLYKAQVSMKEFKMLPLDGSISHTGDRSQFSHFQQINLEESNRLLSRLKIGEWAKYEAFATVGVTPQRIGNIAASESATGVQQAISNSYSQTENLFVTHISFLMPRVKSMLINAAQYFAYTERSSHLQYTDLNNSSTMFSIDPDKLLPRDIGVFVSYRPDINKIVEDMKMLVMNNNTTNASIYDILKVLELDTPSEIVEHAKSSVDQFQQQQQQMQEQASSLEQERIKSEEELKREEMLLEKELVVLNNEKDVVVANIRALGFARDTDLNKNEIPDQFEIDKFDKTLSQSQDKILLQKQKQDQELNNKQQELQLQNKKLDIERYKADNALKIARENQTAAELKAKKNNKKK